MFSLYIIFRFQASRSLQHLKIQEKSRFNIRLESIVIKLINKERWVLVLLSLTLYIYHTDE